MNDKQRSYRAWQRWRHIKPWYFLVLALICGVICVFALRANNLKMVELRQAVYQADKDNGDVEGALRNLRVWVYGHMNTGLSSGPNAVRPPIQLKYTYERLVAAQQAGAQAANNSGSDLYSQAQQYCEKAIPTGFSGSYRLSCIQSFVKQRSGSVNAPESKATPIPKNLYQFDFVAPLWSPDLAGWSLVATFFFVLMAVFTSIYRAILRHRAH